jgi:hypothetical protein
MRETTVTLLSALVLQSLATLWICAYPLGYKLAEKWFSKKDKKGLPPFWEVIQDMRHDIATFLAGASTSILAVVMGIGPIFLLTCWFESKMEHHLLLTLVSGSILILLNEFMVVALFVKIRAMTGTAESPSASPSVSPSGSDRNK